MIIMISGKAESGKTTLAKYMEDSCVSDIYKVSFGTAVKDVAYDLGWDGNKDESGRKLLQWLGDGAREYNPNIWVNKLMDVVDNLSEFSEPIIIIDDVRYLNEIVKFTKEYIEVVTVRIDRPNHENSLTEEQRNHPSEIELDNYYEFDWLIHNDGTLEDLKRNASQLLRDVFKCHK